MIEEFESDTAKEELLRADHLFHVTLKYTRTADVIKNIIKRLLAALDYAIVGFLKKKKIEDVFANSLERCHFIEKKFPKNKAVQDLTDFCNTLNTVDKAKYTVKEEYRKHVTLITPEMEIDIPKLKELFDKTRELIAQLEEL